MSLHILRNFRLIKQTISERSLFRLSQINHRFPIVNQRLLSAKQSTTDSEKQRGWPLWKGIVTKFAPIGICLIAVMQWRAYRKHSGERIARQWEVKVYCALPLRVVSRCWGWIADKPLPESVRPYVYGLYANTFGVNLAEALDENLKSYSSLADFFARALKEGVRIVDKQSCIVSPCDGTVLHFGTVQTGQIEQVKGVTYSLENFLGENTLVKGQNKGPGCDYQSSLLQKSDVPSTLYQCVIYLAPGDYHRFHSPTDWQPTHRRHFTGKLLSVNPSIARWLPGLFCLNERAVYLGHWKHGFFSFTAVGATNVGSVKVYFDKTLQTNRPKYKLSHQVKEKCLGSGVLLQQGDAVGEFRMGSTIVLVFEAPSNFQFNLDPGQRVQMGQGLGHVVKAKYVDRVLKNTRITNAS